MQAQTTTNHLKTDHKQGKKDSHHHDQLQPTNHHPKILVLNHQQPTNITLNHKIDKKLTKPPKRKQTQIESPWPKNPYKILRTFGGNELEKGWDERSPPPLVAMASGNVWGLEELDYGSFAEREREREMTHLVNWYVLHLMIYTHPILYQLLSKVSDHDEEQLQWPPTNDSIP